MKRCRYIIPIAFLLFFSGKEQPPPPNVIFRFQLTFEDEPLRLKKEYTNAYGETFSLSMVRFYLCKMGLQVSDTAGASFIDPSLPKYTLVDLPDSGMISIPMRIRPGSYQFIRMQMGVDSADQTQGAQTGALDPIHGMFWTWNSGYVTAKIEGRSNFSTQPFHAITYHLGGYRSPNATVQQEIVAASKNNPFIVRDQSVTYFDFPIDVEKLFYSPFAFRIRETPTCTTPGPLAKSIANNFMHCFSFDYTDPAKP